MDNIVGVPIAGIVVMVITFLSTVYVFAKESYHPEKNMVETPGWFYVPAAFLVSGCVAALIFVVYQNSFETAVKMIIGWGLTLAVLLPIAEFRDRQLTRQRLAEREASRWST